MGEAKRKRELLRQLAIEQLERWDFAESGAEARAVEEIKELPLVIVERYPLDTLAYMRMKPNQCHANARFMQDQDPEGRCKQVAGYWPQAGNYVFHSVVERDGRMFCVTPMAIGHQAEFPFIPDPDIEWKEEAEYRVAYRKGLRVEPGFRGDPAESKRIAAVILARIEAGMNPLKAGEPPF